MDELSKSSEQLLAELETLRRRLAASEAENQRLAQALAYSQQSAARLADGAAPSLIAASRGPAAGAELSEQMLKKHSERQGQLLDSARHLTSSLDVKEVLTRIATEARAILDTQGCSIYTLSPDGKTLLPVVAIEPPIEEEILATPLPVEGSFTGQSIRAGRGLIFNDAAADNSGFQIPGTPLDEQERVITVPFSINNEILGAMCLSRSGAPFTQDDLTLVETFATYAATALKNARVHENLEREVAERKRAEEALRQSEARYRTLFDGVPVGLYRTTPDGHFLDANPALVQMLGYPNRETLLRANVKDLYVAIAERNRELAVLDQRPLVQHFEIQLKRYDGLVIEVADHSRAVRDTDGQTLYYEGSLEDVTERKRAEEAVRVSEATARALLNAPTDSAILVDRDLIVRAANETAARTLGRRAELLIGTSFREMFEDAISQAREDKLHEVIRGRRAIRFRDQHTERMYDNNYFPVFDAEGQVAAVAVFSRDITEQIHLEQRLREAEKMEAIGRLAGGIAHEFNNLLTVINGYSEFALNALDPNHATREDVDAIRRAGLRAAELTRQLLAFSRRQMLRLRILDLNSIVANTARILRRLIGEDIRLHLNLADDLASIRADAGQIEQVILNLASNARDAMPNGGALTIETSNIILASPYSIGDFELATGRYALLAVSDTGCGLSPEMRAHLFEPFYTTKELGQGTGLGLATVYGIVRQLGGNIHVYSEVGQGTTFKVYLPQTEQAAPSSGRRPPRPTLPRGHEMILVVEDDDGVRKMAVRMLQWLGYEVLEVSDATAACEIAGTEQRHIDLILTDVVMPEISGPELVSRLGVTQPNLRVLYMSGYPHEALGKHGVLDPGTRLLVKPFDLEQLAIHIRQALDE